MAVKVENNVVFPRSFRYNNEDRSLEVLAIAFD